MAMEVKVYYRKKNRGKSQQIDHIPKCFQLPRSASTSKPRTEFFLPICSFKDVTDLEFEPQSSKEVQSSVTVGSSDMSNDTNRRIVDSSSRRLTNGLPFSLANVKSLGQKSLIQPCNNRKDEDRGDALEVTPNRYQLTETSNEVCTTPGSVVWAKTDENSWWPAEILGDKSRSSTGRILVRFFNKHGSAWIDPATNLSSFKDCFEERSCNEAEEFQNALKQALDYKEHLRSCKKSSNSPDGPDRVLFERDNSSSSSRAGTDCRTRSKRERKRKVHFDEVTRPLYTSRKVRRFKIMRSLGLAAPVGSPFNSS